MSNTARKARKAAGTPFQHPTKEGTPVLARSISTRRKVEEIKNREMDAEFAELYDKYFDENGNPRQYDKKGRKKK